ncbi:MAG TPA: amino acid adenylation domain-containing protein [candidate division Zixibacteria bacterium]|nr:amino acid adenylation domain-containing protein [candidate division Zixibacteria bacterium]
MSFDQPELLARGAGERQGGTAAAGSPGAGAPAAANPYDRSNLTPSQLQIWLAQNLLPEAPVFNLACALYLDGQIDVALFRQAFSVLVASSDALRTRFEEDEGIPLQTVLPSVPSEVENVDLSGSDDPRAAAKRWMQERCGKALDWRGRLFESALIRLAEDRFVWYLNVHHLVCDGWSFEVIYRRTAELYCLAREGRLARTVDLPPFADYVAYERSCRRSARYRKTEDYWKAFVADVGDRLDFYGRVPTVTSTRVRRVSVDLGRERTKKAKSIAAALNDGSQQVGLFGVFAAALIGYLHCLNGHDSYTIGVPSHNRRTAIFKDTIGLFSEVLPVRTVLADDETFASLARKFTGEVRRTLRYGQYAVTNPLFRRVYEVALNYHTRSFSEFAGIPARPEWVHNGHGDESLAVQIHDFGSAESLSIDFDLHESAFGERDGRRVTAHFQRVLDNLLREPDMPLRRLSLASEEKARRLTARCNPPETDPEPPPVHVTLERRAAEAPDRTAVLSDAGNLTYGELNRRAGVVARLLRARGIGRGERVSLYLPQSPATIAAMLGVLKAGAAYVPIDPRYSSGWLEYIVRDTGARAVLTERKLAGAAAKGAAEVICLDDPGSWRTPAPDGERVEVSGEDLAYVIYTSGSAGVPKGVEIPHRALANFVSEAARIFEIAPSDRVLQFASISFDTSAEEIFPCLTGGAALVFCRRPECIPPAEFLEQCRARGITVLDLPTAYWHGLTACAAAERLKVPDCVRLVIIGGERAIPERVALWQAFVGPKVRLLNTYGPTETAVAATVADLTNEPVECGVSAVVPIGRPIANVQALVLDRNLKPVPDGVPGQLYIGGIGLARGYAGRPDLTSESFIPNPFGSPGSRLYRTGDIVRCREDGSLEFLGRADDQVKIRGFRVEPEGVAAALRKHPLIRDAAVLFEEEGSSGRLVAYVVPEEAAMLNPDEVQGFLRSMLPEYMVPSAAVVLESLPLTPRGKLDRRALRLARNRRPENLGSLAPPRTPVEKRIAALWRDLLGLEAVGRDQHFFELGGHSLLAAQAVSRIRRELGIELPLRALFEAPTLAALAERVEQALSRRPDTGDEAAVPLGRYRGWAPASDSQTRIWYMEQFAPESGAYNVTAAIRFTGTMDREALRRAVDRLVERHEALRTTFQSSDGRLVQVIAPALQLDLPEIDLGDAPEEKRIDLARQILREEARRPFDIARGPLTRLLLVRLGDRDHLLSLVMHHLISDQWSLGVIAREISASYNAHRNGVPPPAAAAAVQYGDFALWQNERVTEEQLRQDLAYWKRRLSGMQPASVPTDRPRPAVQTFRGTHRSLAMSAELIERLRKIALEENATLYMVFLAAFKVLLSRYCARDDVALGSPVANRTRAEWESVIGTFINVLVLRTDLSGNPSLREVVRRVREVVLDAFAHQELPFQRLVKELAPGRDASRSPLVQVLFNFQNAPLHGVDFDDISWSPFEIEQWAAQFDLGVTVDPAITRKIFLSYNTDLYEGATAERILREYVGVLEAIATDAEQRLASFAVRLAGDAGQGARGLELRYPRACLHELFEEQVERTPEAVALVFENQVLSYRELNERANRLARRLRQIGVGPGALVGICAERSAELVAGLLGILKAGGAYVPIDPAYPNERIGFILEDSGVAALVTQRILREQLTATGIPFVCLNEVFAEEEPLTAAGNLPRASEPDETAYVIYTSGSTGQPKGVRVPHRAVVNFLYSMKERPGISGADVMLSVTTISFDIAVLELFLPLITGARVVIAGRETVVDGRALGEKISACGATIMQATPTTWRMMVEAGWEGSRTLKVLCGGESLRGDLARELLARSGSVWNLYGPTETTVWSTVWKVEPGCERVTLGRPIHNTEIHILDGNFLPVPVGVVGEIYIGGDGVALGYLNRPELTAERFVPNPFGPASSRLYRTGDLGRHLADGNIEFIGRTDSQVKIRGFRVELGEIEAVLSGHEGVKEVVAAVRGGDRLVAYVVAQAGRSLEAGELREYARGKLPGYMVPGAFVFLDRLPLTPNGKIDRQALPEPDSGPRTVKSAPKDRLEFEIANVWKRLLKIDALGAHENFFELGGNSLEAARLLATIQTELGPRIRLPDFLTCPTVAHLAELARQGGYEPQWSFLVPIQPNGSKPPFFWVHGHATNSSLARCLGPDQPVYALIPQALDGKAARYTSVEEIALQYLEEIRSIQPRGPYFLGGYSFGGMLAFEMARQLRNRGEEVSLLALLDGIAPALSGNSSTLGISAIRASCGNLAGWRRICDKLQRLQGIRGKELVVQAVGAIGRELARRLKVKEIRLAARRTAYRFCVLTGRDIPHFCRSTYITDLHVRARRAYRPGKYRGSVVFFRAEDNPHDYISIWRTLIEGDLEVYSIQADHTTIAQEPQVTTWAERLGARLNEAQQGNEGPERPIQAAGRRVS